MIKKFFLKRFKSYFLIMFLPMAIIFIVSGYFLISAKLQDLRQKSTNTLENFDKNIESSLYNLGFQLDIMMSNSNFSLALKNLLGHSQMEQKDLSFHNVLKNFLTTYELSNDYIHSIYLYIDNRSKFMTSSSGQIVDLNTSSFYDMEWLLEYKNMEDTQKVYSSNRWLQRNSYDEPIEVISVYYKNTYLNGVTVINIDKGKYGSFLRKMLISDSQKLLLVNNKGKVLCVTDQSFETMDSDNQTDNVISELIKSGDLAQLDNNLIKIMNNRYFVNYKYSEYMNIYLVSVIPIEFLFVELNFYIILAGLVLILMLLIIIGLAYGYTKRSFYYIEECINVFSEAEKGRVVEKKAATFNDEYELLLSNIILMHLNNNKVQMELLEKQHLYEMTQMTALQLQINPHFIFNTLQIMDIEVLQFIGEKSTLHKIIQQLSMVIKYALTTPTVEVTLKEELTYLKAYLEIQNIRFNNNAITYFDIDDELYETKVFRMLLQPVLENSFSHGRRGNGERILIKIKIHNKGDYIKYCVIDNGQGMTKEKLNEVITKINDDNSKSIGLTNLNRRLCLRYGYDSRLKIKSKKNMGTIVEFKIPI